MKGFHYCEFCGDTFATFLHDFEECDWCAGKCDDWKECKYCLELYED